MKKDGGGNLKQAYGKARKSMGYPDAGKATGSNAMIAPEKKKFGKRPAKKS